MGANPHANGGLLLRIWYCPISATTRWTWTSRARDIAESTRCWAAFFGDVMKLNMGSTNFRVFGPDETMSNRLDAVFDVTDRCLARRDDCPGTTTCRRTAG